MSAWREASFVGQGDGRGLAVWLVRMRQLEVRLLGRFEVLVDSRPVPADAWAQRRAADLVKVLALASGHRMPRDEVLELLWPKLGRRCCRVQPAQGRELRAQRARRSWRGRASRWSGRARPGRRGEHRRRALRAWRRLRLWRRAAARRALRAVDSRPAREAARAPPRGDALPGPLGGGAARGRRRRGGPPRADAPPRGERRQASCRASVPPAARRARTDRRGALRGDAGAPARTHARPGGPRGSAPSRSCRGA